MADLPDITERTLPAAYERVLGAQPDDVAQLDRASTRCASVGPARTCGIAR
jgi:hypothetical protein